MRVKTLKVIFSFPATVDAMAMEEYCGERGIPGRLIPLPPSISAGCGLCWCAAPEDRDKIEKAARDAGLRVGGVYELML